MIVSSCDNVNFDLPAKHRFPTDKYSRLRSAVEGMENLQVVYPDKPSRETIEKVHAINYVDKMYRGTLSARDMDKLGFPWSRRLLERALYSVGCTIGASFEAMKNEISCSLAGGTHHADRDFGKGFCIFNDIAIASTVLLEKQLVKKILIVDTDVHQGNGTANLLRAQEDVYTLSLHSASNYPHLKAVSNLDVSLPNDIEDTDYLEIFSEVLEQSIECSKPQVVFFLTGADIFEGDRLGRLRISKAGIRKRDDLFFSMFDALKTKIIVVMGGGYAPRVRDIVDIHVGTVEAARNAWERRHN